MYRTISSRLTAHFNVDGKHLHRYVRNKPIITKSFCEDLILHDQILIPTQDFLTACGLILIIGEKGFLELLENDKIKFIRTRSGFGFVSGKGPAEICVFGDPANKRPMDSPIDESVNAGLKVIESGLKEKKKLLNNIVQNSYPEEWSVILKAVKQESIKDLKYTKTWKSIYESNNPNYILLPKSSKSKVKVIGPNFNPKNDISDALLALTQYNSDLFLADKYDCHNISPFFPIGDLLQLKKRRFMKNGKTSNKIWTLLEVNGVPDLSKIKLSEGTNMSNFLKLINNKNSNDFRIWFHNNEELNEKEILREYVGVLQQVPTIDKLPSKSLRFAVTSILGFIPVIAQMASFFDSFVLNKLFKGKSPKFFIDDLTNFTGDLKL